MSETSAHPILESLLSGLMTAVKPFLAQLVTSLGNDLVTKYLPLLLQVLAKGVNTDTNPVKAITAAHAAAAGDEAKFGAALESMLA